MSIFPNPHISHPYSKIGFTNLSNRSIWISYGKLKLRIFLRSENNALFACSAICFFAFANVPVLLRYMIRYLYDSAISSSLFWNVKCMFLLIFPRPNIAIFVFETFTCNFHVLQYSSNTFKACCRLSILPLKRTVSSAYIYNIYELFRG